MCIICIIEEENIMKKERGKLYIDFSHTTLNVSNCSYLTSNLLDKVLKKYKCLKVLECYNCPLLTFVDISFNLELIIINCSKCDLLNSLVLPTESNKLKYINISSTNISKLDLINLTQLSYIFCTNCRFLIYLDNLPRVISINSMYSPWAPNEYYNRNYYKILQLQRWWRTNRKIKLFNYYIKSKQFVEWIYSPKNIGGRFHKKSLEYFLTK